MGKRKLENKDIWFYRNLICLLGGQRALVEKGHQKYLNRKMILEWINENSEGGE